MPWWIRKALGRRWETVLACWALGQPGELLKKLPFQAGGHPLVASRVVNIVSGIWNISYLVDRLLGNQ